MPQLGPEYEPALESDLTRALARLLDEARPGTTPGAVSQVNTNAIEEVKAAGGSVFFGPADLPNDSGRVAMLRDPEGAFIGIVQQERHPGAQVVNEPGAWTWNNLLTRDLEGAQDFYGQVFGWSAIHNEEAPPGILMWQVEGQRWPEGMAGLMEMTGEMPSEMPAHWQVYFVVENMDEAIEKATSLGAKVGFGPIDVPVARLATLVDPQGAVVSILEANYPEPR